MSQGWWNEEIVIQAYYFELWNKPQKNEKKKELIKVALGEQD